tara:strand:- start:839 stop:1090 length:252 start_codon:yes stop_codon:yes gene_type:complete
MENDRDNLERIYKKLKEEENLNFKKWNESFISKIILLFPLLIFFITFLKVNSDKSVKDLIAFVALGGILVAGGLGLNLFLKKK